MTTPISKEQAMEALKERRGMWTDINQASDDTRKLAGAQIMMTLTDAISIIAALPALPVSPEDKFLISADCTTTGTAVMVASKRGDTTTVIAHHFLLPNSDWVETFSAPAPEVWTREKLDALIWKIGDKHSLLGASNFKKTGAYCMMTELADAILSSEQGEGT